MNVNHVHFGIVSLSSKDSYLPMGLTYTILSCFAISMGLLSQKLLSQTADDFSRAMTLIMRYLIVFCIVRFFWMLYCLWKACETTTLGQKIRSCFCVEPVSNDNFSQHYSYSRSNIFRWLVFSVVMFDELSMLFTLYSILNKTVVDTESSIISPLLSIRYGMCSSGSIINFKSSSFMLNA